MRAEHQDDGRRIVIGIAGNPHHLGVHAYKLSDDLGILHSHNPRILVTHARRSVGACFEHGEEFLVGDLFGFVLANAAALE